MHEQPRYLVLSGGVGGAKLVRGMQQVLTADRLIVVANTGDDFNHLGLPISPDIDTLMYTLADKVNRDTGWGLADDTWELMTAIEKLGGDAWFRLGDHDIATHVRRREWLAGGDSLSVVTRKLCAHFSIDIAIVPMTDDPVRTQLDTTAGVLDFQDYFVRRRAEPAVRKIHYAGADSAQPAPAIAAALADPALAGIVISPSNPWLSIAPMLAIPALRSALIGSTAPVVAVSPIVAGQAIKGPTAKLMQELGLPVSVAGIAAHYQDVIDALIIDRADAQHADEIGRMGLKVGIAPTIMRNDADKAALAEYVAEVIAGL
jgi:LPPG:FO 2-phospho-L-lactate transferase